MLRDNKSRAISPSQRGACRVVGRARASKGRRGLVKGGARRQIQLDLRGNEGDELVVGPAAAATCHGGGRRRRRLGGAARGGARAAAACAAAAVGYPRALRRRPIAIRIRLCEGIKQGRAR